MAAVPIGRGVAKICPWFVLPTRRIEWIVPGHVEGNRIFGAITFMKALAIGCGSTGSDNEAVWVQPPSSSPTFLTLPLGLLSALHHARDDPYLHADIAKDSFRGSEARWIGRCDAARPCRRQCRVSRRILSCFGPNPALVLAFNHHVQLPNLHL